LRQLWVWLWGLSTTIKMINLIPKEEKKKMATDFYRRFAILILLMLSFCLLVATLAILPAYFLSSTKNSIINAKLEIQSHEEVPIAGEQSLAEVKDINQKLSLVENAEKNKFPISTLVVNKILQKKTPDIKIIQITYENDASVGKKIGVLGTASSRDTLLMFEQAFENDPAFKNVDLPISSFVKVSNIQFDLTLTAL
jgi:hypothetical protein